MYTSISQTQRFKGGSFQAAFSLTQLTRTSLQCRKTALAQIPSYVDHTGVARRIAEKLISADHTQLRSNLLSLALTAYESARILKTLLEIKRQDMLLKPGDLLPLIKQEAASRGYTDDDMALIDVDLLTELISRPTPAITEFVLRPITDKAYPFLWMDMYDSIGSSLPARAENEEQLQALYSSIGSMVMADMVFTLLHTPSVFITLLGQPGGAGSSEARNRERANALSAIASFAYTLAHSSIFASAAVNQHSYDTFSTWLGGLPSLYATGDDPIEKFVVPIDILNIKHKVLESLKGLQADIPGSSIKLSMLSEETFHIFKSGSQLNEIIKAAAKTASLSSALTSDLTQLTSDPDTNRLLMQMPIGEVPKLYDARQLYDLTDAYHRNRMTVASAARLLNGEIIDGGKSDENKDVFDKLRSIPTFGMFAMMPMTPQPADVARPAVSTSGMTLSGGRVVSTLAVTQFMGYRQPWKLGSLRAMISETPVCDALNYGLAEKLGKYLPAGVRSAYPSTLPLEEQHNVIKIASIKSATAWLETIASFMGRSRYVIEQEIISPVLLTDCARVLSSFMLFGVYEGSSRDITKKRVKVIDGNSKPYGVSFSDLMNCVDDDQEWVVINADMKLAVAPLARVPIPTTDFVPTTMDFITYVAQRGDSNDKSGWKARSYAPGQARNKAVKIEDLVVGPPMLHYAIFSQPAQSQQITHFYDLKAVYAADIIVGNFSPSLNLVPNASNSFTTGLSELSWAGPKAVMTITYVGFKDSEGAEASQLEDLRLLQESLKAKVETSAATAAANPSLAAPLSTVATEVKNNPIVATAHTSKSDKDKKKN